MKREMNRPDEIELILQELFFWECALRRKVLCGYARTELAAEYKGENTVQKKGKGGLR